MLAVTQWEEARRESTDHKLELERVKAKLEVILSSSSLPSFHLLQVTPPIFSSRHLIYLFLYIKMEVKAKENVEKHMSMAMDNYEKVAEAKNQSGSIQAKEWTQMKESFETKVIFLSLFFLFLSSCVLFSPLSHSPPVPAKYQSTPNSLSNNWARVKRGPFFLHPVSPSPPAPPLSRHLSLPLLTFLLFR